VWEPESKRRFDQALVAALGEVMTKGRPIGGHGAQDAHALRIVLHDRPGSDGDHQCLSRRIHDVGIIGPTC
jgi:hypothetical protein